MKGSRDSCRSTFPKHLPQTSLCISSSVRSGQHQHKISKVFNFQNEGEFSCVVCIILYAVSILVSYIKKNLSVSPPPVFLISQPPPPYIYIYHLIYHILTILTPIHSTSSILNKSFLNSSPSLSLQSLLLRLLRPASSASRPTPLTTATPQRAACPMR